jgi:probable rRNA maturation factor
MDVTVTNLQNAAVDSGFVRDVLVRALRLAGYRRQGAVGVALVDDAYIRALNREYRGGDYATDVLSFPLDGGPGPDEAVLGDIVISVERARAQAREYKQPFRREVALLAIHGLLHLLGYDDETEDAASAMRARQTELLAAIVDARARRARGMRGRPAGAGLARGMRGRRPAAR